jgi:hypothetical protein
MKVLAALGLSIALLSGCGGSTTAQPAPTVKPAVSKTPSSAYENGYYWGRAKGQFAILGRENTGRALAPPGVQCGDVLMKLTNKKIVNYSLEEENQFFKACVTAYRTFTK